MAMTSVPIISRSATYFCGKDIDDVGDRALAVAEVQDLDRRVVRHQHPLRHEQDPAAADLVIVQAGVPRQDRPARFGKTFFVSHRRCRLVEILPSGTKAPGGMWPST